MLLHGKAMPVAHRTRAGVCAVRAQKSSLAGIGQIRGQNLGANTLAKQRVFDWENYLDSFVKISLHPVGAAQVQLGLCAIFEIIDTAVLQKTPDDAAHTDAAAQPTHAGNERALAAHDQIDL